MMPDETRHPATGLPKLRIMEVVGGWSNQGKVIEPPSWEDLLGLLMRLGGKSIIYRGQSRASWSLTCTLTRRLRDRLGPDSPLGMTMDSSVRSPELDDLIHRSEQRMMRIFVDRASELGIPDLPARDDRLAWWELMQHHGTPTRLLDWTRSPFVALWFAMEKAPDDEDSALWVFDTETGLMNLQDEVISLDRAGWDTRTWQNRLASKAIEKHEMVPVALQTSRLLPRAVAQQSVVTLIPDPGPSIGSSAHLFENLAQKVPIPMEWRDSIRRALESMGITRSSLMMDLDSTGAELSLSLGF